MDRHSGIALVGMAILFGGTDAGEVRAQEPEAPTEQALQASEPDAPSGTPEGEQRLIHRLTQEFNVDESRVTGLRKEGFGYGEIRHVLGLAQQMPGGITEENIDKIRAMRREQDMGWGNISKELLGTKLGQTAGTRAKRNVPGGAMEETGATDAPETPSSLIRPGRAPASMGGRHPRATATHRTGHTSLHPANHPAHSAGSRSGVGGTTGSPLQHHSGRGGKSALAPGHNR